MPRQGRTLTADVPFDEIRPVPGFPGYFVTANGRVFFVGELKPNEHGDGYLRVNVMLEAGKRLRPGIHQLVCRAFHGPPIDEYQQVRHLDGDRLNNGPDNLKWGTVAENGTDRARHNSCRGENNGRALLTRVDVNEMKQALDALPRKANGNRIGSTVLVEQFRKRFGVSKGTIHAAVYGQNWGEEN